MISTRCVVAIDPVCPSNHCHVSIGCYILFLSLEKLFRPIRSVANWVRAHSSLRRKLWWVGMIFFLWAMSNSVYAADVASGSGTAASGTTRSAAFMTHALASPHQTQHLYAAQMHPTSSNTHVKLRQTWVERHVRHSQICDCIEKYRGRSIKASVRGEGIETIASRPATRSCCTHTGGASCPRARVARGSSAACRGGGTAVTHPRPFSVGRSSRGAATAGTII